MKIKISNLANGTYDYLFEGEIDKIKVIEPYFGKYDTEVVLTKFDNQIILDARTSISTKLNCDRCMAEFEREILSSYRMVYLLEQEFANSEKDRVEVCFIHPNTENIDVSEDVKDFAMLALPMKKLCKDDCLGLCYHCGENLNEVDCGCAKKEIDPRWEPILKLKNK